MDRGYADFQKNLNNTGRPMVFSCSWPVYQIYAGIQPNFTFVKENCNLWRSYDDIQDSWASVESIIDYFGNNQEQIAQYAGPGHWNDPDMVRKIFKPHTFSHFLKYCYIFILCKNVSFHLFKRSLLNTVFNYFLQLLICLDRCRYLHQLVIVLEYSAV